MWSLDTRQACRARQLLTELDQHLSEEGKGKGKGKEEGEQILAAAKKEAEDIIAKAKADAEETVRKAEKEAEADLIRRQRDAEAKKYEAIQEAEAKRAEAEALRFAMEQEAEGIRAKGVAEAEAIEKKAEAQKRMGEASILEMYLSALPEVVKNAAGPLAQTDKIVMYGDGNATKVVRDVMNSANQIMEGMKEATGIDLQAIIGGAAAGRAAVIAEKTAETTVEE